MTSSRLLDSRAFRPLLAALLSASLVATMISPASAAGVTDTIVGDPADAMAINTGDTPNSNSGTPLNLNVINAGEPSIRSGRYDDTTNADFGSNSSAVFVFQLPDLGAIADPFVSASFTFNLEADVASGFTHSLYGLDARTASTVLAEDFQFATTNGTTAETLLQSNILVGGATPSLAGSYTSDDISSWLNLQYNGGAAAGQYVFLRISAPGGNTAIFNGTTNGALITSADAASNQPVIDFVARPPDFTWDGGGGDGNWSTSANWTGDVAPAPPTGLVFAGTTNTATNNDLTAGTEFYRIDFSNTGNGESFSLAGNAIALCQEITTSAAAGGSITDTITLDIELTQGNSFVDLGAGHDLDLTGVISGSQRLLKTGDGTLTLSSANAHPNTSIGELFVAPGGTLVITHEQALGTGQARFERGGTLELGADGLTILNDIFVPNWGGSVRTIRLDLPGTNTGTLAGNSDVRWTLANGFVLDVGADDTLTMTGTLSTGAGGGAGITKTGDGTLDFRGVMAANYRGNTTVNAGTLSLGDGTFDPPLPDAYDVIVATGATLDLNFTGTDVIDELFLGGVQLTAGVYDSSTHPGFLTGTGSLTVTNPPATVPEIIDVTIDGSGNVILTLDGSAAGLTAQQSDDLGTGSFADVASTPGADTLTIDAANVDPNADGADHYRVRN